MIRSLLVAPAADAVRLAAAFDSAADALVIDLLNAPDDAASAVAGTLRTSGASRRLVRLRALDDPRSPADIATLGSAGLHGFILSGAESGADVQRLGAMLAVEEAKAGLDDGAFRIVAVVETGGALYDLVTLGRSSDRLDAIAWDGEALSRDLGEDRAREGDGLWNDPCATARMLTLAACVDAGLPAIDSIYAAVSDDAFRREAETARRDGFSAKFAIDERQVAIVNAVFGATV